LEIVGLWEIDGAVLGESVTTDGTVGLWEMDGAREGDGDRDPSSPPPCCSGFAASHL